MGTVKIRSSTQDDHLRMLEIYAPYILSTAITFDTTVPSLGEWSHKIIDVQNKFPWIVAEEGGRVMGYAYASPFKSRSAFEWSVDSSIYVDQEARARGIGKSLYEALRSLLKEQGVVNVIGGIALPNEPSVKFHEKFDFKPVARFLDVGFKLGKWWDVGYWQLQLQKLVEPKPLAPPAGIR